MQRCTVVKAPALPIDLQNHHLSVSIFHDRALSSEATRIVAGTLPGYREEYLAS